jgi:hypothetical protein
VLEYRPFDASPLVLQAESVYSVTVYSVDVAVYIVDVISLFTVQ